MSVFQTPRGSLLPVAARTANPADSLILNPDGMQRLRLMVHMTAVTATGTVTITVYEKTAAGTLNVLLASTALAAAVDTIMYIGPTGTPAANLVANLPLPREIVVKAVHGNGVSMSYGLDFELLP